MKALLFLSMLSFSNLAFSATQKEIIEVLKDSLDSTSLVCKESNVKDYEYGADRLDIIRFERFKMTISTDKQPALVFSNTEEDGVNKKIEVIAMFATDEKFMTVTRATITTFNSYKMKVNVGNIINPVFKIVEKKYLINETICE